MKVKGGRKSKFSPKRMASLPRWRKTRPESRDRHRLTPFERLAILAIRRSRKQAGQVSPAEPPPLPQSLRSPDIPPSLIAERAIGWCRKSVRRSLSGVARALGGLPAALGRIVAAPWVGLAESVRTAFAPVKAEGDRQRGAMAFHAPPREPATAPAGPALSADAARAIIAEALNSVPDKGDSALPHDLSTLALLLSDPLPVDDFRASDLVRDCFASHGANGVPSRALLAVAIRLTREFGQPTRRPLAADRAWRMLDPVTFEDEMAEQLNAIRDFISNWQKTQQTFLVLEFSEIDLIEWLFECLHPGRHSDVLFEVMNFKVLSNRRQGILRRIPHRVRKFVKDSGGGHEAVLYAAGTRAYLNRIVTTHGFTPIVETATLCLEEVEKVLEKLRPPALPGPAGAGEGQALARITPVKMPASELADQAIAASRAAMAEAAPQPQQAPLQPQAKPAAPIVTVADRESVPIPRQSGRRAIASGPRFSAATRPLKVPAGIGIAPRLPAPAGIGTAGRPILTPGQRPPLPAIAMGPMPILVGTGLLLPPPAETAKPANSLSGRIALPRPGTQSAPQTASVAKPPLASRPTADFPADGPPETRGTVTALTVVPRTKRLPITQAIKRQSVLKVLKGESAASVAATLGIREAKLDEWVDAFITAGAGALSAPKRKAKPAREAEPLSAELLRTKLAEVLATAQLIERAMEAQLQPRRPVLLPPPTAEAGTTHPARRPRKKG